MNISREMLVGKGQENGKMRERTKWKGNSNEKGKRRNKSQGYKWRKTTESPLS